VKYDTRDLAMTQDFNSESGQWEPGDLMLSAPALDSNGQIAVDSVDLYTRFGYENLKQILAIRFLTRQGDYSLRPALGHNLNRIMGRRLSKELIEQGKQLIMQTLTYDNLIAASDIAVSGLPFDRQTILYTITIQCGLQQVYRFNLIYNADPGTWRIE
jgi:hypothetical protein